MTNNYMAMILLTEKDDDIRGLTKNRNIASTPVGGRYRVIDFALSNMVNAGLRNVGLFVGKQNSRSLVDHLGSGGSWDLDRKIDGMFLFNFAGGEGSRTDICILENNLEYFYRSRQDHVFVTTSYMVCSMDAKKFIKEHEESGADISVVYKNVKNADVSFYGCDTLNLNEDGYVEGIGKNLHFKKEEKISLEGFIMKKDTLIKMICEATQNGSYTSFKALISSNVNKYKVKGIEFEGYLRCINSTKEYFKFNMDLLNIDVRRDLFFRNGRILTKIKDTPPSLFKKESDVTNSLIANGCTIEGSVKNSIISRHVKIEEGTEIEDCVILQDCTIKKGSKLKNVVIDKNTVIAEGEELKASVEFPLVIEKKIGINSERFKELYWPLEDF
ncbi:glucose-1-phosphate adenylyltransferase subunit GlgD [uncultured Ilyobacter sp.]|uniref:glucose-1-phosphate adenylyltransferase subunit GlgD n=1 Tax=uncultured Ilyobacter sp. TaxID=544433 RepID=UPI0029F54177|nr:glucose-1-phosphate adenylyltransferase subunit GlgD [uncultured Ilyobacter sp.]